MPQINLDFKFSSPVIKKIFEDGHRNIAVCGGLGSGKTYGICQKVIALMLKFPGYRVAIGRFSSTALKRTTQQTFYKVCPPELYDPALGGKKVESNPPYLDFVNGSRIYWMHFDADVGNLLSLEINMAVIDQAEEVSEETYLMLDSRVGRWDNVEVPEDLLAAYPNWPRNNFTNKPLAPSYHVLAFNPPDEGEFSFLFTHFHPDSDFWQENNKKSHIYYQIDSRENEALPEENKKALLSRDPEWIDRYVKGNFQRGEGAIHYISKESIIEYDEEFVNLLIKKGALMRVLDHGESAPTCCTWWSAYKSMYFCYREYYQPGKLVSYHRERIAELSGNEVYNANYADPSIFRKESSKNGGWWSVDQEYTTSEYDSPPLFWSPADNNELATRNRINEFLAVNPLLKHPITREYGAPRLYFIKRNREAYPFGANNIIRETNSQRKVLLAEINGKRFYGDEREPSITDHAYDTLRYHVATHLQSPSLLVERKSTPKSFTSIRNRIRAMHQQKAMKRYGSN